MNPEILKWARETAGLSPEEAAQKLGVRGARGLAHGMSIVGKNAKDPEERMAVRTVIVDHLSQTLSVVQPRDQLINNGHALDSALYALAGIDFLNGDAAPPSEEDLARKEGWIWLRDPDEFRHAS